MTVNKHHWNNNSGSSNNNNANEGNNQVREISAHVAKACSGSEFM